jgi:hypothetical protein
MADFISNDDAQAFRNGMQPTSAYDPNFEVINTQPIDEQADLQGGHELPQGIHFFQTSTTNPARPRTLRAGYDTTDETMYVIFNDGTYWYYSGVDPQTWDAFKQAESKGQFLNENGFDAGVYDMGPVDLSKMSISRRAALTANLEQARMLQQRYGGKGTYKRLYGKGHDYRLRGSGGFRKR